MRSVSKSHVLLHDATMNSSISPWSARNLATGSERYCDSMTITLDCPEGSGERSAQPERGEADGVDRREQLAIALVGEGVGGEIELEPLEVVDFGGHGELSAEDLHDPVPDDLLATPPVPVLGEPDEVQEPAPVAGLLEHLAQRAFLVGLARDRPCPWAATSRLCPVGGPQRPRSDRPAPRSRIPPRPGRRHQAPCHAAAPAPLPDSCIRSYPRRRAYSGDPAARGPLR